MSASGVAPALELSQKIPKTQEEIAAAAERFRLEKEAARAAQAANTAALAAKPKLFSFGEPARVVPNTGKTGTSLRGGLKTRRFKKKRLMSRKYCKKTPCRRMGFTQKASCRPYKNCYTRRR